MTTSYLSDPKRNIGKPDRDAENFITVKYTDYGEYYYFGSFLVSLGQRAAPTNNRNCFINRMWANDKLIYDRVAGWYLPGLKFVFYPGTEDQGDVKNGFHYRGLMCVYFMDLALKPYGDTYPSISAEIFDDGTVVNETGTLFGINSEPVFYMEINPDTDRIVQLYNYTGQPGALSTFIQTVRLSTKAKSAGTLIPAMSYSQSRVFTPGFTIPDPVDYTLPDANARCVAFLTESSLVLFQENTAGFPTDKIICNMETGDKLGTLAGIDAWDYALGFRSLGNGRADEYFAGWAAGDTSLALVYVRNGAPQLASETAGGFFPSPLLTLARGPETPGEGLLLATLAGAVWLLHVPVGEHPAITGAALHTPGAGVCYNAYVDPRDGCAVILVKTAGNVGHAVKVDMTGAVKWTSANFTLPGLTDPKWKIGQGSVNLIDGTLALNQAGVPGGLTVIDLDTGAFTVETVSTTVLPNDQTPVFWDSQSRIAYTDKPGFVKVATPVVTDFNVGTVLRQFAVRVGYEDADIFTENMEDMPIGGYVLTGTTDLQSIANGLGQLYGFSWLERNEQAIFKYTYDTDGELIVDVTADPQRLAMLTESMGDNSVNSVERSSDDPFPNSMSLTFFDIDRNYEAGYQSSKRSNFPFPTQTSVGKIDMSMPIVLNSGQAKKLITGALNRFWGGKVGYSVRFPAEYMDVDPADIIEFTADGFLYQGQVTQQTINADNSVSVSLSEVAAAFYPVSVAVQTSLTPIPVPVGTPLNVILVDITSRNPSADRLGELNLLAIMAGYRDNNFAGGTLEIAPGNAPNDFEVRATLSSDQEGFIGFIDGPVADIVNPFVIDTTTTLRVKRGNIPLSKFVAATDGQMIAGKNLVMIGKNDEAEFITFGVVTPIDAETVSLSRLMRGRYGTEIFVNSHAPGDFFSFLDNAQVISYPTAAQNQSMFFRGLGVGQPDWQADIQMLTPTGNSRKPYAPVNLLGTREDTGDISFTWTRRARFFNSPATDFAVDAMPLDEAVEGYEFEVYSEDWSVLLRRETLLNSPAYTYTIADQILDGTNEFETINALVYQKNDTHVVRGFPGGGTTELIEIIDLVGYADLGGEVFGFMGGLRGIADLGGEAEGDLTAGAVGLAGVADLGGDATGDLQIGGMYRGFADLGGDVSGDITSGVVYGDPYFADVVLLMHMEGTDGQTSTVDSSVYNHVIVRNGAVVLSTDEMRAGVSSSDHNALPANYWQVTPNAVLGLTDTDPWTIEAAIKVTDTGPFALMGIWGATGANCNYYLFSPSAGTLMFTYYNASIVNQAISVSWSHVIDTWYDIAVDYDGTDIRIYVDGVMLAKGAFVGGLNPSYAAGMEIGHIFGNNAFWMPGFVDEVRITNGTARYASDGGYTVRAGAFPDNEGPLAPLPDDGEVGAKQARVVEWSGAADVVPSTASVTKPVGLAIGHVMVAMVDGAVTFGGWPSGWTDIATGQSDVKAAWKVADAGDVAATNTDLMAITGITGTGYVAQVLAVRDAYAADPIADVAVATNSSMSASIPSVTPSEVNSLWVAGILSPDRIVALSSVSGMVIQGGTTNTGSGASGAIATLEIGASLAATGTKTAALFNSGRNVGLSLIVRGSD